MTLFREHNICGKVLQRAIAVLFL